MIPQYIKSTNRISNLSILYHKTYAYQVERMFNLAQFFPDNTNTQQ